MCVSELIIVAKNLTSRKQTRVSRFVNIFFQFNVYPYKYSLLVRGIKIESPGEINFEWMTSIYAWVIWVISFVADVQSGLESGSYPRLRLGLCWNS